MAVATPPELNHSRMLASSPAETVLMCPLTFSEGTPSARHFSMMTLLATPSSLAMSEIRLLANLRSADRDESNHLHEKL